MQNTISISYRQRHIGQADSSLVAAFFHLAHLLKAGVDISDALDELIDSDRARHSNSWRLIARRINQGQSLSEAMADKSLVFKPQVIALIKAGESSGEIAGACHSCMKLLQWQLAVKSRMITVLIYPVFALAVLMCVVAFLFVYIVPAMSGFLLESSTTLSWHAHTLIVLSDWMLHYAYVVPLIVVFVISFIVGSRKLSPEWKCLSDYYLLRLPFVGKLVADLDLSRYANTCAHLYGSGVSLSDSMGIAEGVVSNAALKRGMQKSRELLLSGMTLATSLDTVPMLPRVFKRVVAAGESAGALEQGLLQASQYQKQQCDQTLERTEKLITPVLMLLIGAVVLWIVISLLGPVYQSAINSVVMS